MIIHNPFSWVEENTVKEKPFLFWRTTHPTLLGFLILPVLVLTACETGRTTTPPKVTGPAAAVATTSYEGEGRVISINEKRPSIEIDHKEIKGLMPAMTMEFFVKDKSLITGLKAGDNIEFSMDNGVGGLVITKIKKR